jgi:hypothetical protein
MKLLCECGQTISDTTDRLPYKAYFIADQDLFDMWDTMDKIIADVADARKTTEEAERAHRMASSFYRTMYQCLKCGRLLVADLQGNRSIYAPTSTEDSRNILEGKNKTV